MKKQLLYALLPVFVLAIVIIGSALRQAALRSSDEAPDGPSEPQQIDIIAVYHDAVEAVNSAPNLSLSVSMSTETQIGAETFTEKIQQTIRLADLGTETPTYALEETITLGDYRISTSEVYADGIAYYTIGNDRFCGSISAEAYLAGHTPVAILNDALYNTVTYSETDSGITISFSAPVAPEVWAMEADAVLTTSEGKAYLDNNNQLTGSEYTVIYHHNTATIKKEVSVTITPADTAITPPDTSDYLSVTDPEAILLLERACGYLIQSNAITATSNETISCELFGDVRKQSIQLSMFENSEEFLAKLCVDVSLANSSRGDEIIQQQEIIRFLDNTCTVTSSGVETVAEISAQDMRLKCQNLLLGTILLPADISGVQITDLGDTLRIDFTPNDSFALAVLQNISQTLYQKPDIFHALSDYYATNEISCYLTVDKHTGIPLSSGIHYSGTHAINEYSYQSTFDTEQIYSISSSAAYDAITE